jgi:membrane metallo-endopeptidase-like protein 1
MASTKKLKLCVFLGLFLSAGSTRNFHENDIPELDYLDISVDPCDDFYRFTCGNFGEVHPRPATLNILDHFTLLEDELVQIGAEILSSAMRDDEPVALKKTKAAYRGCVGGFLSNNLLGPEMSTVAEFGGMPLLSPPEVTAEFSWNDIGELVGLYGVPLIFTYTVGQTSQNESLIRLSSDSLSNPTLFRPKLRKTYEEVLEEDFKEAARSRVTRSTTPAAFDVFLRTLAKNLLQQTNTTKSDEEIIAELDDMANFMRKLYVGGILDGDIIPLESEVTVGELQEWTDQQFAGEVDMNWVEYLSQIFRFAGVEITEDIRLYHPGAEMIYGVLNLVKNTDPKIVKNFALLRVFLFQAPDSDTSTRKAFEDYYNAKGYQLYPRWEYCTRKLLDVIDTATLSYAITYDYQLYHYDINKISEAFTLVQNIRDELAETLGTSQWMDVQSRDSALKKAENMLVLLGFPDFVDDPDQLDVFYQNLRVCQWDNYGNARNIRAFKQAYQFSQLGKPERNFWGLSTFDPNAYYNRPNNKIVIPISMLNPVFFYGDNPVLDYSRLGSIIGHEVTHGFDSNGKEYDENGQLQSWWSSETMQAFTERTECFEKQYSQYFVPEVNAYVNGSYCVNENLADNGGVREAFRAYQKVVQEEELVATGNYTLEQLFFIGYGTMWCSQETSYALSVILSTLNGYPPKRFRVIGSLSNMEEFSTAFSCPIGSGMNPENKCLLW